MRHCRLTIVFLLLAAAGCGTSKWTDTGRSATEQLLITDAMDRAVSDLDFRALAGKTVFIDSAPLKKITDSEYLVSCLRQQMLACECVLKDAKTEADYVVEVRAGAVGTDRHDLLYGVPAVNVPTVVPVSGIPSQIPEMPFIKKTDQRAVVRLSLFAYNQKTGRRLWQSGAVSQESDAKAVWVLGAGPFQRGTIFDGMEFAGDKLDMPLVDIYRPENTDVSVNDEALWGEPEQSIAPEEKVETAIAAADKKKAEPAPGNAETEPAAVVPVGHTEPSSKTKPAKAASAPSPSPGPPAAPSGKPAGATKKPPTTAPVASQEMPNYSPNDLAPALTAFPFGAEPRLFRPPVSDDSPAAVP
jgi:hypothetical protein